MTVSGNPASFVVRGAAAKVNSLTVPFSPIQDLNGYSHPWPAGGGKNKLPINSYEDKTRSELNATFAVEMANIVVGSTDNFVISGRTTAVQADGNLINIVVEYLDGTTESKIIYRGSEHPSGAIAGDWDMPLTTGKEITVIRVGGNTSSARCTLTNLQLEEGSTATAYAPYSNICPISGRTGLSVYVSPTTSQADATTYAVDWTSEAGTVYGGTLDVVTGLLTVDRACVDMGSLNYSIATSSGVSTFRYNVGAKPVTDNNQHGMTSIYPFAGTRFIASMPDKSWMIDGNGRFTVRDDSYNGDTDAFETAMSGKQLLYYLATPITYQLTPQEVELLTWLNNVWSDTDSVITIDYDVLSFIRQKFIVNGTDFSRFVERDSYQTSLSPVYGETVQTIDGVGHTARLRLKGALRLALNPQTDTDTAAICTELLNSPCEVIYHCLQRDADVAARMTIDTVSASFLSRCLYWGDEWNQIDPITLTEL